MDILARGLAEGDEKPQYAAIFSLRLKMQKCRKAKMIDVFPSKPTISGERNIAQDDLTSTIPESMVEGKPSLDDLKRGEQVRVTAEYVLKHGGFTSAENTLSGPDLYEKAKDAFPGLTVANQNAYLSALSQWVKEPSSKIICPGRKQGYYTSEALAGLLDKGDAEPETSNGKVGIHREKEKLLYPVLKEWLMGQSYRAKDTSTNRAMGKWGNPDLTGIHVAEQLARFSLEVVTIEAKVSLSDWERWIFEAVSHRRFANRAYFCFAQPEEAIAKIPQDMRYYSELYGIGVLVVSMDAQQFERLVSGQLIKALAVADVDMYELFSAPYHHVQPRYQERFCRDFLEITTTQHLLTWGDTLPDED